MLASLFETRTHPKDEAVTKLFTGSSVATGVDVTPTTSLGLTAVMACVRCIAESSALLPLILYRRQEHGKSRAIDHPVYSLLHDSPNPEMTSMEFRETMTGHLASWGNSFANIEWLNNGYPGALWPLRPDRMRMKRQTNGELRYIYRLSKPDPDGSWERGLLARDVMHIRGLGSNGLIGYNPIVLHMESIGLSLAAEEFGARFFGNNAVPGGVLEHPKQLSDPAYNRLTMNWDDLHKGLENSHRVAILEEGMTYKQIGIPPEHAQFLETRKFQVTEIARIFRVPPHKIYDLDRATWANIEHMSIEFVQDTLMAWLVRWEQRIALSLLAPSERKQFFAEHLVEGLLRGDTKSRYDSYAIGRQWGWLSADDVREKENMDPLPDGQGKVYLVPLNMVPADQVGKDPVSTETPASNRDGSLDTEYRMATAPEERSKKAARSRRRLAGSYRRIYRDTAARILRREVHDIRDQADKLLGQRDYGQFSVWLEEFMREHARWIMRQLEPLAFAYGELVAAEAVGEIGAEEQNDQVEAFIRNYVSAYAYRHVQFSEARIREAIQRAQDDGNKKMFDELTAELDTWEGDRSKDIAEEESVRFGNATAITVYGLSGVEKIRSIAFEDCPYCRSLDGKVIRLDQWMVMAGEELMPDGADHPLKINKNMRHGPYHRGCDCLIVAEM